MDEGIYSVGKVLTRSESQALVDLGSGRICVCTVFDDAAVGDVVFVDTDIWTAVRIDADPRAEIVGIGTVRHKLPDELVIEFAGGLALVPNSEVPCELGN